MRILLIEDEKEIALTLKEALADQYTIDVAFTGEDGKYLAEINEYDIIILDLVLPDTNGIDICRHLRKAAISTPVLMLTGQSEIDKKVFALDAGADDYLLKPYSLKELKARIRALSRRSHAISADHLLSIDDLSLDLISKTVKRQDKVIPLRRKELFLLEYLLRNKGRVITREMILDHVWTGTSEAITNIVDVHIKYLRDSIDKSFDKKLIKTVHGLGYKLEA